MCLSLPLLSPIGSLSTQQNVPLVAHSAPIVSPPPTNPHTGIRIGPQYILNSPLTRTSPTVPTPPTSPVLQEPTDVTIT